MSLNSLLYCVLHVPILVHYCRVLQQHRWCRCRDIIQRTIIISKYLWCCGCWIRHFGIIGNIFRSLKHQGQWVLRKIFNEAIPNKFICYHSCNTFSNVFVHCMNVNKDVLVYFTWYPKFFQNHTLNNKMVFPRRTIFFEHYQTLGFVVNII